ncbi:uncharacterized protein [Clytia hemisphaerica]|uniref:Uncharacterized protein n=1 Tax=Clytia hemisphaerica TaxID=252671 RepID=A0A7M5X666_9CNID
MASKNANVTTKTAAQTAQVNSAKVIKNAPASMASIQAPSSVYPLAVAGSEAKSTKPSTGHELNKQAAPSLVDTIVESTIEVAVPAEPSATDATKGANAMEQPPTSSNVKHDEGGDASESDPVSVEDIELAVDNPQDSTTANLSADTPTTPGETTPEPTNRPRATVSLADYELRSYSKSLTVLSTQVSVVTPSATPSLPHILVQTERSVDELKLASPPTTSDLTLPDNSQAPVQTSQTESEEPATSTTPKKEKGKGVTFSQKDGKTAEDSQDITDNVAPEDQDQEAAEEIILANLSLEDRVLYQQKMIDNLLLEKDDMQYEFNKMEQDLKRQNAKLWLVNGGKALLIRKYRKDMKELNETSTRQGETIANLALELDQTKASLTEANEKVTKASADLEAMVSKHDASRGLCRELTKISDGYRERLREIRHNKFTSRCGRFFRRLVSPSKWCGSAPTAEQQRQNM